MPTLESLKFQNSDFAGQGVSDLPDRPNQAGMSSADVKARFDLIGKIIIALGKFNDLIDALGASAEGSSASEYLGAGPVNGVPGTKIRAQISSLKLQLDNAILGQFSPGGISATLIADGAIANEKLGTDVKVGSLASLKTTVKTAIVNAINELFDNKENAKIAFVDDTASRNIASSDLRKKLRGSHATVPIVYTVPNDSTLTAGVGEWAIIRWEGVAQVSVTAASGVTIETKDGLKISARYGEAVLVKEGANLWSLGGSTKA